MGFFTDSEKEDKDQQSSDFFKNFHFGKPNDNSKPNFFMASAGTSISKICKTDPKDNNFMICTVKEKKLSNENGEDKYVTEEREEREPIGNSHFSNIFGSFDTNSFFGNRSRKPVQEEDTFKEFEESQTFLDFIPKFKNFFWGNSDSNKKQIKEEKANYDNNEYQNQFMPFILPSFLFRDSFFNDSFFNDSFFNDSFFGDGFFNNHHHQRNNHAKNFNNWNGNNDGDFNRFPNNQQFNQYQHPKAKNQEYSYPKNNYSNSRSDDDIYDL